MKAVLITNFHIQDVLQPLENIGKGDLCPLSLIHI